MDQDFLLIGKMRHGDEEAMELFVRKYYPQVLKYCSFHSGDTQCAEDLAQETFLRFFRALAGYSCQGKSLKVPRPMRSSKAGVSRPLTA